MSADLYVASPSLERIDFKTANRGKSVFRGMMRVLESSTIISLLLCLNFLRSSPLLNSLLAKVTPMLGQEGLEIFVGLTQNFSWLLRGLGLPRLASNLLGELRRGSTEDGFKPESLLWVEVMFFIIEIVVTASSEVSSKSMILSLNFFVYQITLSC